MALQPLIAVETIEERLGLIFPEGTPNRAYCTRLIAARTVFTMLYIGAVEPVDHWLAPKHVCVMSDAQMRLHTDQERLAYAASVVKPGFTPLSQRWYADNTREPIRDETLKDGLGQLGAITLRSGIPTTSSKGRYALHADFAALFDPQLTGATLDERIAAWQSTHLSRGALARIQIIKRGAVAAQDKVLVTFPNGETRRMEPGPSSVISKAVIEEFAPRFLGAPGIIWLSESGNKVVARDDVLARSIGLTIDPDRALPDIIVVDLGPVEPLLVFVEVVASDGPMSEGRKQTFLTLAMEAGFDPRHIAFLTAYADRSTDAFRKTAPMLAWRSFAWFAAEPDHILILHQGGSLTAGRLAALIERDGPDENV